MQLYDQLISGIDRFQSSGITTIPSYLTSLQEHVKGLRKAYWRTPVHVDYHIEAIQSAYLLAYFPHYYHLIYKILIERKQDIHAFRNKRELNFTFIGGGPGSEAFGAIKFVADFLPEVEKINATILDINSETWRYSHKIISEHLIKSELSRQLEVVWQSHFVDLINKNSIEKHDKVLMRSDFATMQNCINEIRSQDYNVLEDNTLYIYNTLPKPSNFLMVDLTSSVRGTLQRLENKIQSKNQDDHVFSTLGNRSISSMVSLNAYPNELIRKHLLTGADGLIPRKNLRYDFSLFMKGPEEEKTISKQEETGFSSLYGPMSGKVLSSISGIHDQVYVGIDFGTSVSVASIAYLKDNQIEVESLELKQKDHNGSFDTSPLLPSAIGILKNQYMVGKHAEQNLARLEIGRDAFCLFKDDLGALNKSEYPNSVLRNNAKKPIKNAKEALIEYLKYFNSAISEQLKTKNFLGKPVYCWSVPVDFPLKKKLELIECADLAGFNMDRASIIEEPIAAMINYVHENNSTLKGGENKNVLVVDLGAGTFDVSILELYKDNDNIESKLLAVKREKEVGGNLVNRLMANLLASNYSGDLFYHCEKLKKEICKRIITDQSINYSLPNLVHSNEEVSIPLINSSNKLSMKFNEFTKIMHSYWKGNGELNLMNTISTALSAAKLKEHDIDMLILTGGGMRNPYIQSFMNAYFTSADLLVSDNIQEQVARGNALQSLAHHILGKSIVTPVLHHDLTYSDSKLNKTVLFKRGDNCPTETISIDVSLLNEVILQYGDEQYLFNFAKSNKAELSISIDINLNVITEHITQNKTVNINPLITLV